MLNDGQADISAAPTVHPGPGRPEPLGVVPVAGGVNVAVFSAHAEAIVICLYDAAGEVEQSRFTLPERTGDVHHGFIPGVQPGARYGLRARGPWAPGRGHRFNAAKLLLDPYATAIDRPFALDDTMFDAPPGSVEPDGRDSAAAMPKGIVAQPEAAPAWAGAPAWERTTITEVHVRGFSKLHPGVAEELRGTFAGLASPAGIAHFKALGITTVELMPAMAWADERHLGPLGLTNYWGYNPVALLAPDPRLAPGGWDEVRAATGALHAAGIEVLLDVVYNHSGEGDEHGPTLSFRGLDNASYYRLDASDPSRYVNDAGCGNVFDAEHPAVVRLVLDSLRAWARHGGIDGFRFDLAPVLGRRRMGFDPHAPILAAIAQDPVLRELKLVAEAWDIGPGGYQVGQFDGLWGEWNDKFRDGVRGFWTGRAGPAELAKRVAGSADVFGAKRHPSRAVNFVTAHDGFTLRDLVSYDAKHNEANGEGNRDGRDDNASWNHGVEGPTEDRAVLAARARDARNLLATLVLSRGTPMLGPGTELDATQGGNNNAYSQDNATAWLDWSAADGPMLGFARRLLDLRAAHPALTRDRFPSGAPLPGQDPSQGGLPDIAWRLPDGRTPEAGDWENPRSATLVGVLAAPGALPGTPADRVLAAFHAGAEPVSVALPEPRPGWRWTRALDTAVDGTPPRPDEHGEAALEPRSVVLLVEREGAAPRPVKRPSADEVVAILAESAGIAPEWFSATGTRNRVSPDSKRAILRSMGLDAGTDGEARDSLARLSDRRLRPLPPTMVGHTGATVSLEMVVDGLSGRHDVAVLREDGTVDRHNLDVDGGERGAFNAPDGRRGLRTRLALPPQPAGRHRVVLDGDEANASLLTVAPRRCFIPAEYREGRRGFGVAAHLYTLRRENDGGVGDFTTLGVFAEETARHGGDFVGLNPMHAQFAADRGRASPYNPSDRRFLDPVYIDVALPGVAGASPEAAAMLSSQAGALADLRATAAVDYVGAWAAKSAVLELAFAGFDARGGDPAFDAFVAAGGDALRRFAIFESIAETVPRLPWQLWDAGLREPTGAGIAGFAEAHAVRVRYHLWLQWTASEQFAAAAARAGAAGLSLGFYRDIAVGTAPDGAESWAEAGNFARGVSVGAPPDPFSATGQVWSLPPPNPVADASTMFATLLQANMRHAGALRIDHAMGLQRLFWVPDGASGAQGAYVGYDLERNLADVALESHRARCLVIGEDLGTVPDGFRDRLDAADVLSYRVMFFERDGLNFIPREQYPAKAVACVATHDLPTLAGWWAGADYAERSAIGHMTAEDAAQAEADRREERHRFAEAVGVTSLEGDAGVPREMLAAANRFVAETPCILAVAQAEDLVGETVAVNLPGTSHERPNWQRKLSMDVTDIFARGGGALPERGRGDGIDL